jgi:hypothetical protein
MQNPPIRKLNREQQLVMENEQLKMQLQSILGTRSIATKLTLGEVMDGIAYSIQAAQHPDPEISLRAQQDLANLKVLIEKVMAGQWEASTSGSRIVIPR